MHCHNMSPSRLQILCHALIIEQRSIGKVPRIGIYPEIGTFDKIDISHSLLRCIHKFRFHRFKAHENPSCCCHFCRLFQVFYKALSTFFISFFIINIIPCQLNNPNAQIIRESNRFLHDFHSSVPYRFL